MSFKLPVEEDWSAPSSSNSATLLYPPTSVTPQFSPNRRPSDVDSETWGRPTAPYLLEEKRTRSTSLLPINIALPKFDGPQPKTIFKGFERPDLKQLALHILICFASYPVMYLVTLIAKDRSLFIVRAVVAIGSAGVGFCLAFSLVAFATKYLEAATWATVIHLSYNGDGMKLRDLADNSGSSTHFTRALKLLYSRLTSEGTARNSRHSFDKRPWSFFIAFFVLLMILGPALPFLFGRIMTIETVVRNQRKTYREVSVVGDLSSNDLSNAESQLNAFSDFVRTWTLAPFGRSTATAVMFPYNDDAVYFAQANSSQFEENGYGLGRFELNGTQAGGPDNHQTPSENVAAKSKSSEGNLLRFPQWGIRLQCEKLSNPETYLTPLSPSTYTYAYLQQDFLRTLFTKFSLKFPTSLQTPNLVGLDANDTMPSGMDPNSLSYIVKWYNNGIGHSFHTKTIFDIDDGGEGWTTVETVLVRMNTSYSPLGHFPVYGPDVIVQNDGQETRIGYDVAVCVERYEPWVVETYNSSIGSPTALRIVSRGGVLLSQGTEKMKGFPVDGTMSLVSKGKNSAFFVAHDNSINQMVKDNGMDRFYVPSPTVVSFTDGQGPSGYTELSASRFAAVRGAVDAMNVLPFLVGSGTLVARSYPDQTVAYVKFVPWQMVIILAVILVIGLVAGICVPVLPFEIPRRGFGLYSWIALLKSQELRVELAHELDKMMELEEVEQRFGDKKVKFVL